MFNRVLNTPLFMFYVFIYEHDLLPRGYYIGKTKNTYIIPNLYGLNSEADSRFRKKGTT